MQLLVTIREYFLRLRTSHVIAPVVACLETCHLTNRLKRIARFSIATFATYEAREKEPPILSDASSVSNIPHPTDETNLPPFPADFLTPPLLPQLTTATVRLFRQQHGFVFQNPVKRSSKARDAGLPLHDDEIAG